MALRLIPVDVGAAIAQKLAEVAELLAPFADSIQDGDVLDRSDLRFAGYGEAATVFINRRLRDRDLFLDAAHPTRFKVYHAPNAIGPTDAVVRKRIAELLVIHPGATVQDVIKALAVAFHGAFGLPTAIKIAKDLIENGARCTLCSDTGRQTGTSVPCECEAGA